MAHPHETVAHHVAGRGRRQCSRGLRRGGYHADPDLPDLWAAHDFGAEPENGRDLHRRIDSAVLRPAAGVRGDPDAPEKLRELTKELTLRAVR